MRIPPEEAAAVTAWGNDATAAAAEVWARKERRFIG
jgi:hypothetical protein